MISKLKGNSWRFYTKYQGRLLFWYLPKQIGLLGTVANLAICHKVRIFDKILKKQVTMNTKAFNFQKWIDEHRHLLKPPVGNQQVFKDAENFIVMVVGGPNSRKDYHYNETEEFFYQLEGDMTLKIMDGDTPKDIPISAGEIYLLPPKVPHSPQRSANSIGLVVEKVRNEKEIDGFMWFCENCGNKLYEEYLKVTDIVKQLPPIMNKFNESESLRTCKKCGTLMQPPKK